MTAKTTKWMLATFFMIAVAATATAVHLAKEGRGKPVEWSIDESGIPPFFLFVGSVKPVSARSILFSWNEYVNREVYLLDRKESFRFDVSDFSATLCGDGQGNLSELNSILSNPRLSGLARSVFISCRENEFGVVVELTVVFLETKKQNRYIYLITLQGSVIPLSMKQEHFDTMY